MLDEFEKHLRQKNLSENTISAYLLTIRMYNQLSGEITKQNLLSFTIWKTVMARELQNCIFFGHIPIQFFRHICYIS